MNGRGNVSMRNGRCIGLLLALCLMLCSRMQGILTKSAATVTQNKAFRRYERGNMSMGNER